MPRLLATTWAGAAPTWEQLTLELCRDVYHCLPSALAREPWANVLPHLLALKAENIARKARG